MARVLLWSNTSQILELSFIVFFGGVISFTLTVKYYDDTHNKKKNIEQKYKSSFLTIIIKAILQKFFKVLLLKSEKIDYEEI